MAMERKIEALEVYGDSALVIYQLRGEWETRDSKLSRSSALTKRSKSGSKRPSLLSLHSSFEVLRSKDNKGVYVYALDP